MKKSLLEIKVDEHITLKMRTIEEAQEVFDLVQKNRTYLHQRLPWVDSTKSTEDSKLFIQHCLDGFVKNEKCDLGFYYDGVLVGSGGFAKINTANRSGEIGYWISEEYSGKGIVTKAVSALIILGKEKYDLHRIIIRMDPKNHRSQAVPKRLGFKYEGTMRDAAIQNGKFIDLEMWALLV